jgi:hypothetical protein
LTAAAAIWRPKPTISRGIFSDSTSFPSFLKWIPIGAALPCADNDTLGNRLRAMLMTTYFVVRSFEDGYQNLQ